MTDPEDQKFTDPASSGERAESTQEQNQGLEETVGNSPSSKDTEAEFADEEPETTPETEPGDTVGTPEGGNGGPNGNGNGGNGNGFNGFDSGLDETVEATSESIDELVDAVDEAYRDERDVIHEVKEESEARDENSRSGLMDAVNEKVTDLLGTNSNNTDAIQEHADRAFQNVDDLLHDVADYQDHLGSKENNIEEWVGDIEDMAQDLFEAQITRRFYGESDLGAEEPAISAQNRGRDYREAENRVDRRKGDIVGRNGEGKALVKSIQDEVEEKVDDLQEALDRYDSISELATGKIEDMENASERWQEIEQYINDMRDENEEVERTESFAETMTRFEDGDASVETEISEYFESDDHEFDLREGLGTATLWALKTAGEQYRRAKTAVEDIRTLGSELDSTVRSIESFRDAMSLEAASEEVSGLGENNYDNFRNLANGPWSEKDEPVDNIVTIARLGEDGLETQIRNADGISMADFGPVSLEDLVSDAREYVEEQVSELTTSEEGENPLLPSLQSRLDSIYQIGDVDEDDVIYHQAEAAVREAGQYAGVIREAANGLDVDVELDLPGYEGAGLEEAQQYLRSEEESVPEVETETHERVEGYVQEQTEE